MKKSKPTPKKRTRTAMRQIPVPTRIDVTSTPANPVPVVDRRRDETNSVILARIADLDLRIAHLNAMMMHGSLPDHHAELVARLENEKDALAAKLATIPA